LADSGLPEKLLRVLPVDTPVKGEVDGPLPVMLIVKGHQPPERQTLLGCLGPNVLPAEAQVWQIQPRGLRHLAVTDLRHVV
jgi:hypothetical protein